MNQKSKYLFLFFVGIVVLFGSEIGYIYTTKKTSHIAQKKKKIFTHLCGLPDLAISTEATYIRRRSLSTIFSIYKDDPILREYMFSTYAISYSHIK
ncbi:hypothetical protein MNB_SM-3-174 [hydrothermal vent metagenome]|uniref:Uncharacterized protein n=1 Tax=hydrothermal vent metagenome TaxID=652676 RepID=A0A1W1D2U0_9ZZZZ